MRTILLLRIVVPLCRHGSARIVQKAGMAIGNARNLTGIYEYRARIVHKSEIIPKGVETSL